MCFRRFSLLLLLLLLPLLLLTAVFFCLYSGLVLSWVSLKQGIETCPPLQHDAVVTSNLAVLWASSDRLLRQPRVFHGASSDSSIHLLFSYDIHS